MKKVKYDMNDISNSNSVIWDALCEYEDGRSEVAWAMVRAAKVSDTDMAIFIDEIDHQEKKWARQAEYTEKKIDTAGAFFAGVMPDEVRILARQGA